MLPLKKYTLLTYIQVIVPTLHISLGVYKKIFDLFELDCHELDVAILKERLEAEDDTSNSSFDQQVASEAARKHDLEQLLLQKHREVAHIEDRLPLNLLNDDTNDHHPQHGGLLTQLRQLRTEITELVCIQYNNLVAVS